VDEKGKHKERREGWNNVLNNLQREFPQCKVVGVNSLKRKYDRMKKRERIMNFRSQLNDLIPSTSVQTGIECEVEETSSVPMPLLERVEKQQREVEEEVLVAEKPVVAAVVVENDEEEVQVIEEEPNKDQETIPDKEEDEVSPHAEEEDKSVSDQSNSISSCPTIEQLRKIEKIEKLRLKRARTVRSTELFRFLRRRDDLITELFTPEQLRECNFIDELNAKTGKIVKLAMGT